MGIGIQRIIADVEAEDVAVKRKQRCDIGNMKNRVPHAVGTRQKPFDSTVGAERVCCKARVGEQFDTVAVRVVEMDHALDEPLVTQRTARLGDGDTGSFNPRRQPVEIGGVGHLPPHKGELVAPFVNDHQPLTPVIHAEGHGPTTGINLLHAKQPARIIGPVGKSLRPDPHISKRNNRHVTQPSCNQPSGASVGIASHLGLSPNDA